MNTTDSTAYPTEQKNVLVAQISSNPGTFKDILKSKDKKKRKHKSEGMKIKIDDPIRKDDISTSAHPSSDVESIEAVPREKRKKKRRRNRKRKSREVATFDSDEKCKINATAYLNMDVEFTLEKDMKSSDQIFTSPKTDIAKIKATESSKGTFIAGYEPLPTKMISDLRNLQCLMNDVGDQVYANNSSHDIGNGLISTNDRDFQENPNLAEISKKKEESTKIPCWFPKRVKKILTDARCPEELPFKYIEKLTGYRGWLEQLRQGRWKRYTAAANNRWYLALLIRKYRSEAKVSKAAFAARITQSKNWKAEALLAMKDLDKVFKAIDVVDNVLAAVYKSERMIYQNILNCRKGTKT